MASKKSIYFFHGADEFAMSKAVDELRKSVLHPDWVSFNYDKIPPEQPDAVIFALNQAMTPPFGVGRRLVWLVDTTLSKHCSEKLLAELESTLPAILSSSVLLLTSLDKPDGRLKFTKLLQKVAQIQEFALIEPWKTEQLVQRVQQVARLKGVKLNSAAVELLAESVGNDTRQLYNELDKLLLYAGEDTAPLNEKAVAALVTCNTQNSLKLAKAICQGNAVAALALVADLIAHNEFAGRIVATLIGQFRTWLWVKLLIEGGLRDDSEIAAASSVPNPRRINFLRQEVQFLSSQQLASTLPMLLDLDISLKRGSPAMSTLQNKVIELCKICQSEKRKIPPSPKREREREWDW